MCSFKQTVTLMVACAACVRVSHCNGSHFVRGGGCWLIEGWVTVAWVQQLITFSQHRVPA